MATEYLSNDLCGATVTLPIVNLESALNDQRIPSLSNANENLKSNESIPILQLQTLSDVNLNAELNLQNLDKRLQGEFITLPLGSDLKLSVSYICRLCASIIDLTSAINIFPTDEFQENLSNKINKYLPIVVYESDPFPKTVCKACVSKLNQFHELVEKCILAEEQLRQTYVFDGRYVDELTKKINQRSDLDLLKDETDSNDQLYSMSEFSYIDGNDGNNLNVSKAAGVDTKKDNKTPENLKSVTSKNVKIPDICVSNQESFQCFVALNCKFCGQTLKNFDESLTHLSIHLNSFFNRYYCLFCDDITESKLDWIPHTRLHFRNVEEPKITQPCEVKDKPKGHPMKTLKKRIRVFSKVVFCKKCKESLSNADAAYEHCVKHRPANINYFPCVLCIRRLRKSKIKDHVTLHFPCATKQTFSCDNCNNLYPDEKTLKYHRCTKLRKYKCLLCKQGFKSEDRLKFHEEFHKNKSTFCDICKKDFKFESRLYLHFAGVHNGIRDKPYCCDVCGKTFTWLTVFNGHKRTHTNERPFKCSKCDASFCSKYSLSGHMPSHDDHPQFYCEKCDYHTGRKQNLQKHINRFHKEINSSQVCIRCKICNEIFPNKHHLEVEDHFSRHSQEELTSVNNELCESFQELVATKLYQCERCERCFASADHLTQHRTMHAGDNCSIFYQCRLCGSGFPKHDLLVKHQKVHVNISSKYTSTLSVLTVISCDICGIECVDYRQLLNHKDRGNCEIKKKNGTVKQKKVLIKKHLKPLKTHQLFINANGLFECPSCQRTYKNRRRYRLHLATHANSTLQRN